MIIVFNIIIDFVNLNMFNTNLLQNYYFFFFTEIDFEFTRRFFKILLELVVIINIIYDLYFIRNKILVCKLEIIATENFLKSIKHRITYRFITFDKGLSQFCVIFKRTSTYTVVRPFLMFSIHYLTLFFADGVKHLSEQLKPAGKT